MLFRLFPVFLMVVAVSFFMHTGVQMKCVSKLTDARRTSKGKVISLLDCKNLNRIFNELEKHSLE